MKLLGSTFAWVWDRCPWWVKAFFALVILPNFVFNLIVFFLWFLPWHKQELHSAVQTSEERTVMRVEYLSKEQKVQTGAIIERLERMDVHQNIMLQAILAKP